MATDDDDVFTGIAYDDVPETSDKLVDLTVKDIQGNIDNNVFVGLPVYHEHANMGTKDPIGEVIGAVMVPLRRKDGSPKHTLMLTYKLDRSIPGVGKFVESVRTGALPCLSLSHHAVSKKISEVSVVSIGMRRGTNRLADRTDLDRWLRDKDSRLDSSEADRVVRARKIGLATTDVPMTINASKLQTELQAELQATLDRELELVEAINTDDSIRQDTFHGYLLYIQLNRSSFMNFRL